ncbi:HEAT SHOCK PROTEIN 26 [Salix viminalis]|uniref:HEAT SHOCK PROTEIN 26 n=1 Tax=Salix viminalis TaxID=40686 RepID=A0A9Q0UTS5_SALVM|nr:HEAT SHOCK PROTEIN 26 [Salix viminalis]
MELELGLKITHNRDDITSFTELRVAKNHAGPLFLSRETETKFILIGYLSGFRKENIDIKISEDGDQITISGRKPVQELVLIGLIMHKKEVELRAFSKAFRIPHGVILDEIKAKFSEQDLTLTITLPKSVKGIRGAGIEEVKEEEVDKGRGDEEATGMKVEEIDQGCARRR